MSDKPKFDAEVAGPIAEILVRLLEPFCDRIVVAGSLRRGKPSVGDIEILYIPKFEQRKRELFDIAIVDLSEERIRELLTSRVLVKRPSKIGVFTWGPQNKLAIHVGSGIPVDLFATTEENWFVSLVIRTGSKETNLSLTSGAIALGRKLHAYGSGVTHRDGTIERATSEQHVFDLCGVKYKEPDRR